MPGRQHFIPRLWISEQIALGDMAAFLAQKVCLLFPLDPFSHDIHAEAARTECEPRTVEERTRTDEDHWHCQHQGREVGDPGHVKAGPVGQVRVEQPFGGQFGPLRRQRYP